MLCLEVGVERINNLNLCPLVRIVQQPWPFALQPADRLPRELPLLQLTIKVVVV